MMGDVSQQERYRAMAVTDAEAPYLNATPAELVDLANRLREAGQPIQTRQGIIGWITLKAAGERDESSAPTRAKYRRILRELDAPAPSGPRGRRDQRGVTQLGETAAVAAVAMAATGKPGVLAAASALVYITYTAGDDVEPAGASGGPAADIHTLRAAADDAMRTYYTPVAA